MRAAEADWANGAVRHRPEGTAPKHAAQVMFNALRYYWITAKGYRLRPWKSPYIQWRLETFFGAEAAHLSAGEFFRLLWRERARMARFLAWVREHRPRR